MKAIRPNSLSKDELHVGDRQIFVACGDDLGETGPTIDGEAWTGITQATLTLRSSAGDVVSLAGTLSEGNVWLAVWNVVSPPNWRAWWTFYDGVTTKTAGPFSFTVRAIE